LISKAIGISPSEALKLSEFDTSIILEGIIYDKGGKYEKDGKTNISEMTNEELDKFKKGLMDGV